MCREDARKGKRFAVLYYVDDGDTAVGGEAFLSSLIPCLALDFRPIDLLFRFIGILTSQ